MKIEEIREYHDSSVGLFFNVDSILYSGRSAYQKIDVINNKSFGNVLLLDGLVQTTEKDEFFYHEMLVHPACTTQSSFQNALIIGGGDGGALKEILRYPGETVCHVEIDAQVIEVGKEYFPWLSPCLDDQRVELVIADGLEFLKETERTFDVVFVDSSEPVGPSVSLHRRDFYESLKKRLNEEEAVITAQIGSPLYHLEFIRESSAVFKEIFKIVRFYVGPAPSYPGGSWCYVFLSDNVDPLAFRREPAPGLKYYNLDTHRGAFALPPFIRDEIQ
ncbi:MAG: polyamine aminopropyltransferase [Candidatus Aminicenantes bacterium]|jgi:spermidine synthase